LQKAKVAGQLLNSEKWKQTYIYEIPINSNQLLPWFYRKELRKTKRIWQSLNFQLISPQIQYVMMFLAIKPKHHFFINKNEILKL
jgi:hypothetical protein